MNTEATKTTQANFKSSQAVEYSFGVADRLGRVIGLKVWFSEYENVPFVEDTANKYAGYSRAPLGYWFSYTTQPTRNGKSHQASHSGDRFPTAAERDAAAAKSVEGARKRALAPAARLKA